MTTHNTQTMSLNAVRPSLPSKRQQVYQAILNHPEGIASFQIATELGWNYHYITPRITELLDMGAIINSGRLTHNDESDREVTLWIVTNVNTKDSRQFGDPPKKADGKQLKGTIDRANKTLASIAQYFDRLPEDKKEPLLHYEVNKLIESFSAQG